MFYTEIQPSPALASWVKAFWCFVVPSDLAGTYVHRVLPDGCVSLIRAHNKSASRDALLFLSGPSMEALEVPVHSGDDFYGARLRPGVARALLERGGPSSWSDLRGLHGPLSDFAPNYANELQASFNGRVGYEEAVRVFETTLQSWISGAPRADKRVRQAVRNLEDGQTPIRDVASQVGLSERQLQRLFRHELGLTPKQYARVRRFRTALTNVLRAKPETWGRVALECGFSDQAHMTREFVVLTKMSPEELRAHVESIEHGDVTP